MEKAFIHSIIPGLIQSARSTKINDANKYIGIDTVAAWIMKLRSYDYLEFIAMTNLEYLLQLLMVREM